MPCSLALCRVVPPLIPSSSSANCKRITSLQTSHFTSPLLIWRRLSTEYPGKFFGGPWGVWEWRSGLYLCHQGHVYGCQKPRPCQQSAQQGVRGWSWCASGICSQHLAFHTCAGSSVAPVPYWCAMGASVCWRPYCNGRLSWRMHCKVEGMERGYATQVTESQHEEDKAHGLGTGAWPSSRLWRVPLCSLSKWCWCELYPVLAVHVLGAQEVQWC